MILFIFLLVISLTMIGYTIYRFKEIGELISVGIVMFMATLLTYYGISSDNNITKSMYDKLNIEYNFLINNYDIIPFNVKIEIVEKLVDFNELLEKNSKYRDNIFIGIYYPNVVDSTIVKFDVSKIK